jgi:ubiquitin carboxyl-terminal hydrolase 36/42
MLLATPVHPPSFSTQHTSEDSSQYRPSQDFKALLPPIEFIEGSSSGALAVPEGKYEPINGTLKASTVNVRLFSVFSHSA